MTHVFHSLLLTFSFKKHSIPIFSFAIAICNIERSILTKWSLPSARPRMTRPPEGFAFHIETNWIKTAKTFAIAF
uniref:Secreted protein n=1 Tax=Panagrellus redivivus TaxID=6233 RepID=A0A7E4UVQ4_PANRE